jgi:hypothetical protein
MRFAYFATMVALGISIIGLNAAYAQTACKPSKGMTACMTLGTQFKRATAGKRLHFVSTFCAKYDRCESGCGECSSFADCWCSFCCITPKP